MSVLVQIDDIAKEIAKQVEIYTEDVKKKVIRAENKVTKEAVEELKLRSPIESGRYAEGWSKTRVDGVVVIYNKFKPGLAHLLEHGHVKTGGGRVAGKLHIRPVEEKAVSEFEKLVEKAIKS